MSSFATALSWNPDAVLKAHLKENYPWAEIEIDDLLISDTLPMNSRQRYCRKGPPRKQSSPWNSEMVRK
jgi:hypothetical protein